MAHKALYRRARPRTFAEVVGQGTQVQAITSAIVNDSLPETILLTGHLGCGKTTIARLIAASVNCEYREEGSAEPCGGSNPDCMTCPGVIDGEDSIAVTELDAAQRRSIADVAELIKSMRFRVSAKHKVYIIDEAHQLSKDAASSLLKTLEEPPAGVIIIMATTNPEKLIGTVQSRLRQYSLSSLSDDDLDEMLRNAAEKFDIELSDSDLRSIKSKANSSGRNALSILERMAQSDDQDEDNFPAFLRGVTDSIADEGLSSVLVLVQQRINEGNDVPSIQQGLATHFRDALIAKESPKSLATTGELREEAEYAAERLSLRALLEVFGAVTSAARPGTPDARVALEAGLMGVIYKIKGVGTNSMSLSKKDLDLIVEEVTDNVVSEVSKMLEDMRGDGWSPAGQSSPGKQSDGDGEEPEESDGHESEDDDEESDSPLDDEDATLPPPQPRDESAGSTSKEPFDEDKFIDLMIKSVTTRRDEIFLTRHVSLRPSDVDDDTIIMECKNDKALSDDGWNSVDDTMRSIGWFLKEEKV